ncbi:MAG: hypothetical protein Q4G39_03590 [Brachymonas sp.]|nr:hypothetical protein [Brachymonas sp.]
MNKNLIRIGICAALALAGTTASAGCYSIYNSKGRLVARNPNPPVDMSKHLRHTVPAKYGRGSAMVFEAPVGTSCSDYSAAQTNRRTRTTQDTSEILDNLARQHAGFGQVKWRSDGWIADVEF